MSAECYPMSMLPHLSRLYEDYLAMAAGVEGRLPLEWYGSAAALSGWMGQEAGVAHRDALADGLRAQGERFGAGARTLANVERLRRGARAVVTGQQVGLFGGPLLTLLKAATAVARAREATAATGVEHVPVFWPATEDHDLAEVDQISVPGKHAVETLRLGLANEGVEVGGVGLGKGLEAALERVSELLEDAPVCALLRSCYAADETLGGGFARLMTALFREHGLVVMDARERVFHALGGGALRAAIERAEEFETALLGRTEQLESAGYHAQVMVKQGASLLFVVDAQTGRRNGLRRVGTGEWKAGGAVYKTAELLEILEREPERLSPNALLRPVFQDTILPTAAYIGGPAEVAYFAQTAVLYEGVLGRVTPVLPRLSATLVEPAMAALMERYEVSLGDLFQAGTTDALTQRLGARALPVEGKRLLAKAGNALDDELTALTAYLGAMDESLGRSAMVSASKMRYQMNRLRRMAATHQVQREESLRRRAETMMLQLFPGGRAQERVLGGVWFLARSGEGLIDRLVEEAGEMCLGHSVIRL